MRSTKRRRRSSSPSNDSSKENNDYDDNSDEDIPKQNDRRMTNKNQSYSKDKTFEKTNDLPSMARDAIMDNDTDECSACGTIKSVKLVNFMCHEKFEIKFGPRINFIIGRNGSGKSAILTAVVLALGGRASNTSRGTSFKSFIKSGSNYARVSVTLNNVSDSELDTYKPDTYGDVITIERTLKVDGASSYSIKSVNGRLVSNKKEELNNIVRHFNIQIDNPITILNQEISRNFLNSKNPRDKYNFFMKATCLESIRNDYIKALERLTTTQIELKNKEIVSKDVQKELKELEEKVKLFRKIDEQKGKIEILEKKLLWAAVYEKKRRYQSLDKEMVNKQSKLDDIRASIMNLKAKLERYSKEKSDTESKLNGTSDSISSLKNEMDTKNKLLANTRTNMSELKRELNKVKTEIAKHEKDAVMLEKKINDLREQYSNNNQREREKQEKIERINTLESQKVHLSASLKSAKVNYDQLSNSVAVAQEQVMSLKAELDGITKKIQNQTSELTHMSQSRSNRLKRFGLYVPDLLKLIDDEYKKGNFRHKPIGPIGAHIKLRDPSTALAVECCLKSLTTAYCCDNATDANKLKNLMNSLIKDARKPTIITRRFTSRHNVSTYKVDSSTYPSFLDLMEIDDDNVANVLIDKSRIEQTLYFENHRDAVETMSDASRVPSNCFQAYSKDGTNFFPKRGIDGVKQYASNQFQPRYLTADVETAIENLQKEINNLTEERQKKQTNYTEIQRTYNENKHDKEEAERHIRKLTEQMRRIDPELGNLKRQVSEEPENIETSIFEEELQLAINKKEDLLPVVEQLQNKIKEQIEKINAIDNEYSHVSEKYQQVSTQREPLTHRIASITEKTVNIQKNLDRLQGHVETLTATLNELEEKAKTLKAEILEDKNEALRKTGEEIEVEEKVEAIEKEISDTARFMRERSKEIGDRAKIEKQYKKRKAVFAETLNQISSIKNLIIAFKNANKERLVKYVSLRDRITTKTCSVFKLALETSTFTGELNVHHGRETKDNSELDVHDKSRYLEIKINPKKNQNSSNYNDTRSLSGGERSYGTVAFLVALWEACSSPFKMLDEVDVFMDVVTRTVAVSILIENAKQQKGKQFIFLSPLGLGCDEQTMHVHRMPEPIRGASES